MRAIWSILGVIAIAYAALLAVVFLFQSRLVYLPSIGRELAGTPRDAGLQYDEVWLHTADGERLHAWFVAAPGAKGVVLLCHGNAGNISHRIEYMTMLHRLGYSSFAFDYRGYGRSSGSPSEAGTYRDAEAAWEYLTAGRRFESGGIAVLGESLGGAVAAWLAAERRPAALVLASAFTSVADLGAEIYPFLPVRLLARIRYDTRAYVSRAKVPVLIAHSPQDEIIPIHHGRALFEAAPQPKLFLEMRGGHNDGFLFNEAEWSRVLGEFLDRYLLSPGR
jgi:alpha-beta hydrolase superfamily lysophospholipase